MGIRSAHTKYEIYRRCSYFTVNLCYCKNTVKYDIRSAHRKEKFTPYCSQFTVNHC